MNKSEFAGLSYKELQAIASKYRVPGNIKKKILVKVLDAITEGNSLEVTKLLSDVQNTRKKRTKKIKPAKPTGKSIKSTTHHSNYREENYLVQVPYQWPPNLPIAGEEEISREENLFIPNYADFRQFFMRTGYASEIKTNDRSYSPSVVDLRVGETSLVQAIPLDLHREKNIFMAATQETSNFNYQIIDTDSSLQAPVILKKMLQAPVGVNLKEIAGNDGICKIVSRDESFSNNFVDDSDTLTAESESNGNDDIDNNDNYFCFINNEKNSFNSHSQINELQDGFNDINSNFVADTENQYRVIYQADNQCQKWVDNNCLNQQNSQQQLQNSELYQSIYFDNLQPTRTNLPDQYEFMHNQVSYEVNQMVSNTSSTSEVPYYNDNSVIQLNNNHVYCNQRVNDVNNGYYTQCLPDNKDFFMGLNHVSTPTLVDYGNDTLENDGNVNNRFGGYYGEYQNPSTAGFVGETHETEIQGNVDKLMAKQKKECLNMYWPHWTQSNSPTTQYLENMLNLRNPLKLDTTKLEQTSSVYCYAAPVVSPKPLTELTKVCSQQKRFIAESRRHLFSTKHQIYDDTSTGRPMANLPDNMDIADENDDLKVIKNHDNIVSPDANDNLTNSIIDYSTFNCDMQLVKSTES